MHRFNKPPMQVWAVAGLRSRPEITIERVDPESQLAIPLSMLANELGRHIGFEMIHFPPNHSGDFDLPDAQPLDHVWVILGAANIDGYRIEPGGICQIENPRVTPISLPHAPCVLARLRFAQLHDNAILTPEPQRNAADEHITENMHAIHDRSYCDQIFVEDFLEPEICDQIIANLMPENPEGGPHYGHVLTNAEENTTTYNANVRQTEIMRGANFEHRKLIRQTLRRIILKKVEPFYGVRMDFWNKPVLLKYEMGGFFVPHLDGEMATKEGGWIRIYDRDYTLVTFLNDDYDGGRLVFPDLDFVITPKKGRVCAFPGSHIFRHGAETTTRGTRYQLVSWLTAEGTPRVDMPMNKDPTLPPEWRKSVIYRNTGSKTA